MNSNTGFYFIVKSTRGPLSHIEYCMMGDRREDYTNLSLMLSRVMDDVGVNEECVLRRRRLYLVRENIQTFCARTIQRNYTAHIFGSQTEGTTTDGLNADTDVLFVMDTINVIQDWKDWEPGEINMLMIRDERFPGYCKLQLLRRDVPLPLRRVVPPWLVHYVNDGDGNVVQKDFYLPREFSFICHGPAVTTTDSHNEYDNVPAYKCHSWPKHYTQWTQSERRRDWPTTEMIHYMISTGCFIVKAAHRLDGSGETWRISTSLAERCLMFSLNITQIRCYILLKMIVKTFIQPHLPDTISSYMCKTLLFHCIENTRKEFWKEHNLLQCVHQVLLYMIAAVLDENCPNYFNKSANLFVGKVDSRNKVELLQRLRSVISTKSEFLLEIRFDRINSKLESYIIDPNLMSLNEAYICTRKKLCRQLMLEFYHWITEGVRQIMDKDFVGNILSLSSRTVKMGHIQNKTLRLFLPFVYSQYASIEASKSILQGNQPAPTTLKLFDLSLNSDVTSSRLKFASYLYCTGQLERTLSVLQDVEERMTDSVIMMCGCHRIWNPKYPARFGEREISQQYPTTDSLALCVMFSRAESQCCPRELKCEMFRSTDEERKNRSKHDDNWMDLAVMDALPYLYYLKYIIFRHLGQVYPRINALTTLAYCVCTNEHLTHKETGYNVLGQCVAYEGLSEVALKCYRNSLRLRPINNAAKWLIPLLLFRLVQERI